MFSAHHILAWIYHHHIDHKCFLVFIFTPKSKLHKNKVTQKPINI